MKLSKSLINIRKSKNLSQEQMAETLNVTRQTISNWENNKSYPDLETIVLISNIFKISLDELLKEDKKAVESLNRKIKLHTRLRNIIISLIIIIISIVLYFGITEYKDYLRNNQVIEKLNELGFDKAQSGFMMLEEDGVGYHVYKSEKGKITYDEIYAETRDITSNGIVITYIPGEARVYYFDEKITVYCDKEGNLKEGKSTDESSGIHEKYKDQTVKMIKKMVELFNEIYEK